MQVAKSKSMGLFFSWSSVLSNSATAASHAHQIRLKGIAGVPKSSTDKMYFAIRMALKKFVLEGSLSDSSSAKLCCLFAYAQAQ